MTDQPESELRISKFDAMADDEAVALADMFHSYLKEEFDRVGTMPLGTPVAPFLKTLIVRLDGTPAGFASIDLKHCSVEVVYTVPECRGRGIASEILTKLKETCPRPMELKAPVSPGGQALADRLQIGLAYSTPEERQEYDAVVKRGHEAMMKRCSHKLGNPQSVCKRCYRVVLRKYAAEVVTTYVSFVRDSSRTAR